MQTSKSATALDILMEGKRMFGFMGHRWTRGTVTRRGLTGQNYCSIGAIHYASRALDAPRKELLQAEDYLRKASGSDGIADWNDSGRLAALGNSSSKFKERLYVVCMLLSLLPGMGKLAYLTRIRPTWCKAIRMAADDQLMKEEQNATNI